VSQRIIEDNVVDCLTEFRLPVVRWRSTGSCCGFQQCSARHVACVQRTTAPDSASVSACQL